MGRTDRIFYIAFFVAYLVLMGTWYLGGYDFNSRGPSLLLCVWGNAVVSFFVAGFLASNT